MLRPLYARPTVTSLRAAGCLYTAPPMERGSKNERILEDAVCLEHFRVKAEEPETPETSSDTLELSGNHWSFAALSRNVCTRFKEYGPDAACVVVAVSRERGGLQLSESVCWQN
jgi:hypothetical protein